MKKWILSMFLVLTFCLPNVVFGSVIKVEHISQMPELPTGCEATALTMLLNNYGYKISKTQVAKDLPKVALPREKNGRMYGGHPADGFVGDPFSNNGYGVYSPPIVKTINKYIPDGAEDLTGKSFEDLLSVIDSGRPVMVWTTIGQKEIKLTRIWYTRNNEKFQWKAPEHAVLLTGYDDKYVYVNDPLKNQGTKYDRAIFEKRWEGMGKMAVTIKPKMTASKLILDGKDSGYTYLSSKDNNWIPLRFLPELDSSIVVGFEAPNAYFIYENEQYILSQEKEVIFIEKDSVIYTLDYFYKDNRCYIKADFFEKYYPNRMQKGD